MEKDELIIKLNQKTELATKFIREALYQRTDVNRNDLDDYIEVLKTFKNSKNRDDLRKLSEISSRPDVEGADTNFTDGISLDFDGQHISLRDLLLDIEDIVFEIEKL